MKRWLDFCQIFIGYSTTIASHKTVISIFVVDLISTRTVIIPATKFSYPADIAKRH